MRDGEREKRGATEDTAGRSNNGCWDLFSMWLISNRLDLHHVQIEEGGGEEERRLRGCNALMRSGSRGTELIYIRPSQVQTGGMRRTEEDEETYERLRQFDRRQRQHMKTDKRGQNTNT